jgi:predicted deacylase
MGQLLPEPITLQDTTIPPGASEVVKLNVGHLSSGTTIAIRAHVFRAEAPGPTVLFLGGIHGDEVNGVEIVRRAIADAYFEGLERGSVIAIPLLNIFGFINFSRDVPDGKDVNRSFPGSASGSLAARVAHTLHKQVMPLIDFGVDFHTGGRGTYNYPQIRYTKGDERAAELAKAFAAPLTLASGAISKSLRKTARKNYDRPILTFEGGENLRYDGLSIHYGLAGIRRLLTYHRMLPQLEANLPPPQSRWYEKSSWLRASKSGMFQWLKPAGNEIRKGEPIGLLSDPLGIRPTKRILAPRDGFIIGHNNSPVVSLGDALFNIGYVPPAEEAEWAE